MLVPEQWVKHGKSASSEEALIFGSGAAKVEESISVTEEERIYISRRR